MDMKARLTQRYYDNKPFNEFKEDLYNEFDVKDNPKKEKCFNLAWEEGHASGFYEVYNYFMDFVELIK